MLTQLCLISLLHSLIALRWVGATDWNTAPQSVSKVGASLLLSVIEPSWSNLRFSAALVSDCHGALYFASLEFCGYLYLTLFLWCGRGPFKERAHISPCLAEYIKMPRPLLISSQSDYLIRVLIEIYIFNDKQCRSRSVGFFRSQVIWIYTVC